MANLRDLYFERLKDLYEMESLLADAWPLLLPEVASPALHEALESHLDEGHDQIERLARILANHGIEARHRNCRATRALIAEIHHELDKWEDEAVRDASLLAGVQRLEHHEISCYGTALSYAQTLKLNEDAQELERSLGEEKSIDAALSDLAIERINPRAQAAEDESRPGSTREGAPTPHYGRSSRSH